MRITADLSAHGNPTTYPDYFVHHHYRHLLSGPAAVDDQGRAGYKGGLVRGKIERGMRNLVRSPHASDGLASMELPAHLVLVAGEMARQVVFHKRRLHRAGADGVAANPLRGEVDGDRASQRQHSSLARTIGQAPVDTDSCRDRGNVDDNATGMRL